MIERFDWERDARGPNDKQKVSHGLNLALKLQNPDHLPLLLWDIAVAKPRITRALDQLSFIHFARFVPSWDGRALMVTTEFDGPLEPYVMDFAIALGDVFDILLAYVHRDVRPRLPVRDHPDDFWRFVQEWNRVPFGERRGHAADPLLPADYDYPLYSSYPDKTVIDIVGARTTLPPPAIDHRAAAIDLSDVQGNILSGYRADLAIHLFFRIDDPALARQWLGTLAQRQMPGPVQDEREEEVTLAITSAERWDVPPKHMINIAFTHAGLVQLLPWRKDDIHLFGNAFREGAHARAKDNEDIGESGPSNWLFGKDEQDIHVMLSLYVKKRPDASAASTITIDIGPLSGALRATAEAHGLTFVTHQSAQALAEGREAFGYKDGFSKVRISGQCKPDDRDFQPAASPGEFLLGSHYDSIFGGPSLGALPGDLAQNGTFGVLRLLEQDVKSFGRTITAEAVRLGMSADRLKALLLGRWPQDGRPTALDPVAVLAQTQFNAFDYAPSWEHPDVPNDHAGASCPVGAHIRRTNPRTARVAGQRHSRRLIRRGLPTTWIEGGQPKSGLLGLFIGASIERQFEFIQREWIQHAPLSSVVRSAQDPIAGQRSAPMQFPLPDGREVVLPPWIKTRGSLYLFFPSVSMLRGLTTTTDRAVVSTDTDVPSMAPTFTSAAGTASVPSMASVPLYIRDFLQDRDSQDALGNETVRTVVMNLQPPYRHAAPAAGTTSNDDLSPSNPRFMADPCSFYAKLRQAGTRVVWASAYQAWWVLGVTDVRNMLDHPEDYLQRPAADDSVRGILTMEEPRHRQAIHAIEEAFAIATRNQDAWTTSAIDEALERLQGLGQFDFVRSFGTTVPQSVYWRIFGLADAEVARCDALAQTMMRHYGQPDRAGMSDRLVFRDAATRLTFHLGRALAWEWSKSLLNVQSPGLIGEIAKRTEAVLMPNRPLTFLEALTTLVQLALVHMSAQFLLGTAVRNLLLPDPRHPPSHPSPWRTLSELQRTDPTAFDAALEVALNEARRFDAPVTLIERFAARPLTIGDVAIEKDAPVFAVVASANRDVCMVAPGQDPEQFHWNRRPEIPHLSLGRGIHLCAGRHLQSRLTRTALKRLLDAMPELRLNDETAVPAWVDNIYFRALQSLPVTRCP